MNTITFLRQARIGPFAIFDFAVSYLGMYLLAPLLSKFFLIFGLHITRTQWLWLTLPISIVVHLAIGKMTPLTKMFIDTHGNIIVKIIILYMIYRGIKG